jgi:hypothetical protein
VLSIILVKEYRPNFKSQESDHLKPGEWIRLVVINRATGYMGTQRIQLSDASQNPGGYLNVPVEDIILRPPNLKIWAQRYYTHDNGLTRQQESRNNVRSYRPILFRRGQQ